MAGENRDWNDPIDINVDEESGEQSETADASDQQLESGLAEADVPDNSPRQTGSTVTESGAAVPLIFALAILVIGAMIVSFAGDVASGVNMIGMAVGLCGVWAFVEVVT